MALQKEIKRSLSNNFGRENFDEHRFGRMPERSVTAKQLLLSAKRVVKKAIGRDYIQPLIAGYTKYEKDLELLYNSTNAESRDLLVKIIAYRILGYSKVKLPFNNEQYWRSLELVKTLKEGNETYDPHFMHFILDKFNLVGIGYDIKFFFSEIGVAIDFIAEQYAYKVNGKAVVEATDGDIVLDVGGCWGDTALYFATKVGESGKVYSFEFIPDNIKLHNINTALNPKINKRIEVIPNPVSEVSGTSVYFLDRGPGSNIQFTPFEGQTGSAETISIDDFVEKYNVPRVDYIKMDIEGAESGALKGAEKTIKKFKPKLAIATYHSMEDFAGIPTWILNLNVGYELFIGHYTIHAEETVCFAKTNLK